MHAVVKQQHVTGMSPERDQVIRQPPNEIFSSCIMEDTLAKSQVSEEADWQVKAPALSRTAYKRDTICRGAWKSATTPPGHRKCTLGKWSPTSRLGLCVFSPNPNNPAGPDWTKLVRHPIASPAVAVNWFFFLPTCAARRLVVSGFPLAGKVPHSGTSQEPFPLTRQAKTMQSIAGKEKVWRLAGMGVLEKEPLKQREQDNPKETTKVGMTAP